MREAPSPVRPPISDRALILICALMPATGALALSLFTPALPELVATLNASPAAAKATLTAYFAAFALMQLIVGPLSDAFGRKPISVIFISGFVGASVLAYFAPTIEWLIAARALQGCAASVGIATMRAVVRDLYTGQAATRIMNIVGIVIAVGPALGPLIGGLLLTFATWRDIFLVTAIYGVVVVTLLVIVLPETNVYRHRSAAHPAKLWSNYVSILTDRRFLAPALVLGLAAGLHFTSITILPFVLIDRIGLSPAGFGLAMMWQPIAFSSGGMINSWLLRRIEGRRILPFGFAIMIGSLSTLPVINLLLVEPTAWSIMVPVALYSVGFAMVMSPLTVESVAAFPTMAGAASALLGFMQLGSGFVGGALSTLFTNQLLGLCIILPLMPIIGVSCYLLIGRRIQRQ